MEMIAWNRGNRTSKAGIRSIVRDEPRMGNAYTTMYVDVCGITARDGEVSEEMDSLNRGKKVSIHTNLMVQPEHPNYKVLVSVAPEAAEYLDIEVPNLIDCGDKLDCVLQATVRKKFDPEILVRKEVLRLYLIA